MNPGSSGETTRAALEARIADLTAGLTGLTGAARARLQQRIEACAAGLEKGPSHAWEGAVRALDSRMSPLLAALHGHLGVREGGV